MDDGVKIASVQWANGDGKDFSALITIYPWQIATMQKYDRLTPARVRVSALF